MLSELSPLQATVLGLIAGGTAAGAVHLAKAKLRLASIVTTAGTANPLLSFVEDARRASVGRRLAALVVPLLTLCLLVLALLLGWVAFRRWAGAGPSERLGTVREHVRPRDQSACARLVSRWRRRSPSGGCAAPATSSVAAVKRIRPGTASQAETGSAMMANGPSSSGTGSSDCR